MRSSSLLAAGLAVIAGAAGACERRKLQAPTLRECPKQPALDHAARQAALDALRSDAFEPLHAVELAAGLDSTCARDRAGAVWCWGDRFTADDIRGAPEQVPLAGAATALDGDGRERYCAVLDAGLVQCWTRTGDVATLGRAPPRAALTVAGSTVLLRRSDGSHVCWPPSGESGCDVTHFRGPGMEPYSGLVDGDVVCVANLVSKASDGRCERDRAVRLGPTPLRCEEPDMSPACRPLRNGWPTQMKFGELIRIGPGRYGCALDGDGALECASAMPFGMDHLGAGRVRIALDEPASQLVISRVGRHACALGRSGRVSCWGSNRAGAVGVAPRGDTERPVAVAGLRDIIDIDAATDTFCALDESGGLWCWGALGCGLEHCSHRAGPALVGRFERPTALTVLYKGACVTTADGVRCVGIDLDAERTSARAGPIRGVSIGDHLCTLHDTQVICRERPDPLQCRSGRVLLTAEVGPALAIAGSCALLPDGDVRCWDHRGVVGSERHPEPIVQLRALGAWCGREADGDIYCTETWEGPARRITDSPAVDFAFHGQDGCLVTVRGDVRCWTHDGLAETTIASGARRVAVGGSSACALLADRSVVCWGDGDAVLGRGYTAQYADPLPVVKRRAR